MKVASISFWHLHGKDYAADAQRNPNVDLVAVWDDDEQRGRAAAERFGIDYVASLDEILGDPSIEGVIVCAPTVDHLEIVSRCIRAGKHVFMEKVMSVSLGEAKQIAALAREYGVAFMVSMWRSDRGFAGQIARMVADGVVGEVTSARVRDGHPFALPAEGFPDGILPATFYDPAEAVGGVLIDLCHPLYLLSKIVGYPQEVVALFGRVTHRAVEDNAAVLLRYSSGAIAVAETTYVSQFTPFSVEVHGTDGSILYSEPGIGAIVAEKPTGVPAFGEGADDRRRLRWRSMSVPNQNWQEVELEPDSPVAFEQWVANATSGSRPAANLDLAVALSGIVEAAYASARERRVVATDPL